MAIGPGVSDYGYWSIHLRLVVIPTQQRRSESARTHLECHATRYRTEKSKALGYIRTVERSAASVVYILSTA